VNIWLAGITTCCPTTAVVVNAVCGTAHDEKAILRFTASTNYITLKLQLDMYASKQLEEIKLC
jgi:hypothetical protein